MGGSMAANIARSGKSVLGWNRTPGRPAVETAAAAGVKIVDTAAEAVCSAEIVILCLSDVEDLEMMLFGENGIAGELQKDSIVVDMSTTGPAAARKVAERLLRQHVRFLDAPVSGGDVGARNGTLTIMVGGDAQAYEKALPVFETMGKHIRHCGDSGAGQAVKLCNQVLCAVNMVAVCEAFELAQDMGIDPQLVVDVCETGAAGSWALSNLGPRILRDELGPGFMIRHMLKDLRLVKANARAAEEKLPGTKLAEDKFLEVQRTFPSGAELGTHAMIQTYKSKSRSIKDFSS